MKSIINHLIIFVVIAFSIFSRIPHLGNIEWSTAHILMTVENFYNHGANNYYFSPVFSIENPTDKWLEIFPYGTHDSRGNLYYISFPPLGFLIPYAILKVLNVYPTILAVQLISIGIQTITAYLLFCLVNLMTDQSSKRTLTLPALIAFTVYMLSPETLWFHGNYFMAHLFIHPFWIAQIYLFIYALKNQKLNQNKYLTALALLGFISVYTDWLGVFITFAFALVSYFKLKNNKLSISLVASILLALLAISLQYASISGFGDYFKNITDKFILRSGLSIEKDTAHKWSYFEFQSYANIGYSYLKGYLFLIVLILTALTIVLANSRLKAKVFSSNEKIITFLLIFPVLLHHLILFDFTAAHDSSVLITAPFLAFLTGLLFYKISPLLRRNILYIGLTALLFFTFISSSLNQYTYEAGHKVKLYDLYKNLGQKIKDSAPSDRIIFYCNNELTNRGIPPLSYFAQRSVVPCENKEQAVAQLNKIQTLTKRVQKGIIYYYTNDYLVEKTEEVQSQ